MMTISHRSSAMPSRDGLFQDGFPAVVRRFAVGIIIRVGSVFLTVPLQRAASEGDAAQNDVPDSGRLKQVGQVLHAVLGEAVADAEDAQRIGTLGDRVVGEFPGERIAAKDAQAEEQQETGQSFHENGNFHENRVFFPKIQSVRNPAAVARCPETKNGTAQSHSVFSSYFV